MHVATTNSLNTKPDRHKHNTRVHAGEYIFDFLIVTGPDIKICADTHSCIGMGGLGSKKCIIHFVTGPGNNNMYIRECIFLRRSVVPLACFVDC